MYAYVEEAKQNIQGYSLQGTVGDIPFSRKNVVGNFTVSNKASNPSIFNLGNAAIGQLTGTLHGLNIGRNLWKGKYIVPVVTIGQYQIPYPSKRYRIDEAKHTNGMVSFTAYDDMILFDKMASVSVGSSGTPYDFLSLACRECGVELGMTETQVRNFPNGTQPLVLEELGDIETWRDVLYWVGVTCDAFSRINREGKLELRLFHDTVDDTIPVNVRYDGALYDDDVVTYTGIYVNVSEEKIVKYYAADPDDGYTLTIGSNPFMQGAEAYRKILADNMVSGLSGIEYISGNIEIPFGFHYDLGDVLLFPGGNGSATNKFCIMGYEYTYNGRCKLIGIPQNKKSMSKSDKNIQGLLDNVSKNEYMDYEQKNTQKITIGNNTEERILIAKLASNNTTKALIHLEINLVSKAITITDKVDVDVIAEQDETTGVITASGTAEGSDIFSLVSSKTTKGIVRYLVNSEEAAFKPVEQWLDGNHVLHLMYVLGLYQGITFTFEVYMKAQGGTIEIPRGGLWFYGSGRGLVGDGKWDGNIEIQEDAEDWNLIELTFEPAVDSVRVDTQTPTSIVVSDTVTDFALLELTFENADDLVFVNLYVGKFDLITEAGEAFTTEDGIALVTEHD